MTKKEFIDLAEDFGYSEETIEYFVELHEEYGLSYDEIAIEQHIVDQLMKNKASCIDCRVLFYEKMKKGVLA